MKRDAWYQFAFADGYEIVTAGMTCDLARELMARHGKIKDKRFVAWADEEGGNDDVSAIH